VSHPVGFWQTWFLEMARHVATASKDPSTKVGAVIADEHRRIGGMGYNGFPRKVNDHPNRLEDRATKYKFTVHAEANAILNSRGSTCGSTMYCTLHPCAACSLLIVQAGITKVVCPPQTLERWQEDAKVAAEILMEGGVKMLLVNE
jgi:dCMP deaminase